MLSNKSQLFFLSKLGGSHDSPERILIHFFAERCVDNRLDDGLVE